MTIIDTNSFRNISMELSYSNTTNGGQWVRHQMINIPIPLEFLKGYALLVLGLIIISFVSIFLYLLITRKTSPINYLLSFTFPLIMLPYSNILYFLNFIGNIERHLYYILISVIAGTIFILNTAYNEDLMIYLLNKMQNLEEKLRNNPNMTRLYAFMSLYNIKLDYEYNKNKWEKKTLDIINKMRKNSNEKK